jgi:hypothetical protein
LSPTLANRRKFPAGDASPRRAHALGGCNGVRFQPAKLKDRNLGTITQPLPTSRRKPSDADIWNSFRADV